MSANEFIVSDAPFPRIKAVEPANDLRIAVTWGDGARKGRRDLVDLSPLIGTHKFYRPLRNNPDLFKTVHKVRNGRALEWGNGEIDMAATSVEQLAEETMTSAEFRAFLHRNLLTHESCAYALGYKKRQIENFLSGQSEIPRVVVLACFAYETRRGIARQSADALHADTFVLRKDYSTRPTAKFDKPISVAQKRPLQAAE
jgi:hypothetical protein